MHFSRQAPVGALLAMLCYVALAGTGDVARAPADLRAAVESLWRANPDVAAARAELDAARAQTRAAGQPIYNPELELAAENADVDRRTASLSLGLDLSGKRNARTALASARARVAEAGYVRARRDVAVRWLKAGVASSLAERETQLGAQRLELMQRFAELAERRFNVGDINRSERDLAELAWVEAQAQQAALRGRSAGALASVAALGGPRADVFRAWLAAGLPAWKAIDTPTPVDVPELVQAQARVDAADAAIGVARRARVPDPVVSVTGGRVRTAPGMSDNVVGLNLSLPLPIRNSYRAEVDAARAEASAAFAARDAEALAAVARAQESRARLEALREAFGAFQGSRAADFAQRAALLDSLWQSGELSTSEYLVQLKQSLDTALAGVALEGEAWQAFIDQLSTSGTLDAWLGTQGAKEQP